jgi:hypothetical protein
MPRHEMIIPLANEYDKEYGRWDIAPRVTNMPKGDYVGYLLAYDPETTKFLVLWDTEDPADLMTHWIYRENFTVLTGVVF